jgi:hypothetical protein
MPAPDFSLSQSNADAARATVEALRSDGQFGEVDEARIAAFLSLAEAVDARPWNDRLWREYREAEIELRAAVDDTTDDERAVVAALYADVGDATFAGTAHAGP